jgi:hypothetical protein
MPNKIVDGVLVELTDEEISEQAAAKARGVSERHLHVADGLRSSRQNLLEEADYKINTLVDQGADASAWRTYRQALRDITNQVTSDTTDISSVTWPTKPQ